MKTIKPPEPLPPVSYHLQCQNRGCRAVMEVQKDELTREIPNYCNPVFIMVCPHCSEKSYFDILAMAQARQE